VSSSERGEHLTILQLFDLVSAASGWGRDASISFRTTEREPSGEPFMSVGVRICGGDNTVSATDRGLHGALVALLVNIEMHHREVMCWHQTRLDGVRKILDAEKIYYVGRPTQ
jgi:hypothetical protein